MRTKTFLFSIILLSIFFIFSSCNTDPDNDRDCHIVVRNESYNPYIYITDIYIKERASSGYHNVYFGKLEAKDSHYINLAPGSYSVKIFTNEYDRLGNFLFQKSYEIYNPYKRLERGDYLYVIFDGDGTYFEY